MIVEAHPSVKAADRAGEERDGEEAWRDAIEVLICAHDAGGAEILSEWVRSEPTKHYRFLLAGPAMAVFRRKLGDIAILSLAETKAALATTQFVLTGTGWASTFELDCLSAARAGGIFSASYLDHWVNYEGRFNAGGTRIYPDEIWTGDDDAFELARRTFPNMRIRRQRNPYFEKIRRDFEQVENASTQRADEARILYVCEPIAIDCPSATIRRDDRGYNEFDALAFCLDRLDAVRGARADVRVRVRLHPSERPGKYEPVLERFRDRVVFEVSAGTSLMDDCVWSTDVIGCGSMAMMVALLGGRQVFTSIPITGGRCPLPSKEIRYLRELAPASATSV